MDEIASSMQHLEEMQASSNELRERMTEAHGDHQEAGEGLIKHMEMLQEASRVQAAIKESRQISTTYIPLSKLHYMAGPRRSVCRGMTGSHRLQHLHILVTIHHIAPLSWGVYKTTSNFSVNMQEACTMWRCRS